MLGWHWFCSLAECDGLSDPERVRVALAALVAHAAVTPIAEIVVRETERGAAGVQLLAESHAAIHTEAAQGMLFADVFSCSAFDSTGAADVLVTHFGGRVVSERIVERGP